MKNLKVLNILLLSLFIMSFATQTARAHSDVQQAEYINGSDIGLLRDMYSNLSCAILSHPDSVEGKCIFKFAISKEGNIEVETIELVRNISLPDEYVNAVKEAIQQLGEFKPGKQYNSKEDKWEPRRVYYYLPAIFPIPSKYLNKE